MSFQYGRTILPGAGDCKDGRKQGEYLLHKMTIRWSRSTWMIRVYVKFFEIDHPATASLKAKGIDKIGPRLNLNLIAVDFGKRKLVDVLIEDESWNRTAPTIILAEGLLQYLPPQAVQDLFTQRAAVSTESRMAFSYIPTGRDGRPYAGPWTKLVLRPLKNRQVTE